MKRLIPALMILAVMPLFADETEYRVSTPQEFWDAIGPDRTVIIEEGAIILSDLIPDDETTNDWDAHITWAEVGFNPSISLGHVDNLTIRGASASGCSLLTEETRSWVLVVDGSDNFRLENLVLGHITASACMDGVLAILGCNDVTIDGCELFGCGTVGLELENVTGFTMRNSIISDCGHGIMRLAESSDLRFQESEFRDNDCLFGIEMGGRYGCHEISFSNCLFEDNTFSRYGRGLFDSNGSTILIEECVIAGNTYPWLYNSHTTLILLDTEIENNTENN